MTPITGTFLVLNTLLWLVYLGLGQPQGWEKALLVPNDFQGVTLLTSQFVHQSALHLALNMLLLWTFGRSVERGLGSWLFGVLYLGSGVFAGLLHVAVAHVFQAQVELAMPAGGASGAVAGVMGAYAAMYPDRRIRLLFSRLAVSGVTVILVWLGWEAVQAVIALDRGTELGVGHWAHVGGLVFGLILGPALSAGTRDPARVRASASEEALPRLEASAGAAVAEGAALAIERLTRIGAREHAVALYRQAIADGRPLPLPGPVEQKIAVWLEEEREWEAACDAFLHVASSEPDPDRAAAALYSALQLARERLRRPHLAERLCQEMLSRFPQSRWSALASAKLGEPPPVPDQPSTG